jgi:hypothetical protein
MLKFSNKEEPSEGAKSTLTALGSMIPRKFVRSTHGLKKDNCVLNHVT